MQNTSNKPLEHAAEATINIRNLRLRTFIGFNPDETTKQQDVVINIEIAYAIGGSVLDDRVEDALDYKVITKQVIEHVEEGRFLLLEKLVADVLGICSAHPAVRRARVTIDKPHALRFADSVSLTLEYRAPQVHPLRLLEKAS
jgi:D-erythro-7,8-dihydroneopterin triphosphate epimerase